MGKEEEKYNEIAVIFDHVEWGWMPVREAQGYLRELDFKPTDYPDLRSYQLAKSYPTYRKTKNHAD